MMKKDIVNVYCNYNRDDETMTGKLYKCKKCGSLMLLINTDIWDFTEEDDETCTCCCSYCKNDDFELINEEVSIETLKNDGYKIKNCMTLKDCDSYFLRHRYATEPTIISPLLWFEDILSRIFDYEDIEIKEKENGDVCFYNENNEEISYSYIVRELSKFLNEEIVRLHIEHEEDGGFDYKEFWIEVKE
jgi:hypothetical protein